MTKKPEDLLREEIVREIERLSKFEPGSSEHSAAVKSVVELYKLKIDDDKVAVDKLDKEEKRKLEEAKNEDDKHDKAERRRLEEAKNEADEHSKQLSHGLDIRRYETDKDHWEREHLLKVEQTDDKNKDRIIDICMKSAEIILPIVFYSIWMNKGLKFEETGSFTSQTFRGLINRFRPNNK